ncbi:MAG TPA: SAM-dependent methyltransferase, partial [Dokdonella sp.]|nr:SAM-dependent methyltransferase [Dokdonella sp.]
MNSQSIAADTNQREAANEHESTLTRWAERGLIPDRLLRFGIRRQCALRLSVESALGVEATAERQRARIEELRQSPIAIETDAANT